MGVYVRAHPTIELLEDRLYLGKRSPLVTRVETKMFNFAFSQKIRVSSEQDLSSRKF